MPKELTAQDLAAARLCVEVLHAVQKDTRTSGWYRGEVRGKEAVGNATTALVRAGLVQPAVGSTPFRLTAKGKEFVTTQIKEWQTFLSKLDRPGNLEKIAKALKRASVTAK